MSAARSFHDELAARAKALPRSLLLTVQAVSKEQARIAFEAGAAACGLSNRQLAHRFDCDERTIRDYLSGARNVPAWAIRALPEAGRIAALQALLDGAGVEDERG